MDDPYRMNSALADEQDKRIAAERRAESLAALLREHNRAVRSACGRANEYTRKAYGCASYYKRGRDCPNCPRDWLIDDAALSDAPRSEG